MSETQPISKSFLSLDEQRMLDAVEAAHLKARIQELESELASCRECRANLDCLSRGAVPVRDDGAERIRELETALRMFNDRVKAHGDWDDGCFYYNGTSASELQEPMRLADATLQPKDTAK